MLLHEPFSDRMSVSLEERKNNLESHEKPSDLCSSNCITSSAREDGGEAELRFAKSGRAGGFATDIAMIAISHETYFSNSFSPYL